MRGKAVGLFVIQGSLTQTLTGYAAQIKTRFKVIFIFFFRKPPDFSVSNVLVKRKLLNRLID